MAAKDLQPIPGFHQFAEYVKKRGLRRAAVTNSPRLNAEQVLTALKITDFFELLVVGNECKRPKPFPDPYLEAINFFGVEPKQCFVLEVLIRLSYHNKLTTHVEIGNYKQGSHHPLPKHPKYVTWGGFPLGGPDHIRFPVSPYPHRFLEGFC